MMPNYREINYDTTGMTEEGDIVAGQGLDLDTELRKVIDSLLDDTPGQRGLSKLVKSDKTNKNGRNDFLRVTADIMNGELKNVKIRQVEIDENGKL